MTLSRHRMAEEKRTRFYSHLSGDICLGSCHQDWQCFLRNQLSQTDRFHRIPNSGPTRESSLPGTAVEALPSTCLVPLQMEQAPHIQRPHLPESR